MALYFKVVFAEEHMSSTVGNDITAFSFPVAQPYMLTTVTPILAVPLVTGEFLSQESGGVREVSRSHV